MANIYRSEVWSVNFNPPGKGKEIHGLRPALVVSANELNNCPADLVIVLPITSNPRTIPSHIKIEKNEGGLKKESFIKCDQIRTLSKSRFKKKIGRVSNETMSKIEDVLRIILCL